MKQLLLSMLAVVFVVSALAQSTGDVLDPGFRKDAIKDREPIPYPKFRESDAMWSKIIWRKLDLREKLNHPLYFPIEDNYDLESVLSPMDDRFNLMSLLLYKVIGKYGNIQALQAMYPDFYPTGAKVAILGHLIALEKQNFENGIGELGNQTKQKDVPTKLNYYVYKDDYFKEPKCLTKIWEDLGGGYDSAPKIDIYGEEIIDENGNVVYDYYEKSMRIDQVIEIQLKEVWYFDKNRGKMEVRIIGICPVRVYYDETFGKMQKVEVGWFYFPALRSVFANHEVFNAGNDSERRSFDDIFWKRRFSGFIYAESNVYNNRHIKEYRQGQDALLESEEIKDEIFRFEHDLWNY